jgi:hypothetical protein
MVDNIKEKYTTSPEPISLRQTENILEQMKSNSICRINDKGTGFFVKIPYKSKLLPVLITTNHIINIDDIQDNKSISMLLNNDKKIKTIKLDNRLMYTNEKLDVTIIEIKEKYTTSFHEPISLKQTERILEQMKSESTCRINDKGTGFFAKISYKSKLLPVLITTNNVINTDDIQNNKNISLYLNDDTKKSEIASIKKKIELYLFLIYMILKNYPFYVPKRSYL